MCAVHSEVLRTQQFFVREMYVIFFIGQKYAFMFFENVICKSTMAWGNYKCMAVNRHTTGLSRGNTWNSPGKAVKADSEFREILRLYMVKLFFLDVLVLLQFLSARF